MIAESQANQTQLDGWVIIDSSGHTPQTHGCNSVRPGRETAVGYVLNRLVAVKPDAGVCSLYWYARTGDTVTTHPYYGEDGLQRNYVLAGRRPYPAVTTHAAQRGGLAIVVRTISRIHDAPIEFADQWVFRTGRNRVTEHGAWFVHHSGGAALAVRPLSRFRSGSDSLEPADPTTYPLGEDLAVRVLLHSSEEGALSADRLEAAWIVVARDDVTDPVQLGEYLDTLQIIDEAHYDFSLPRMSYAYTRAISVADPAAGAVDPVALHVDYHTDLWR